MCVVRCRRNDLAIDVAAVAAGSGAVLLLLLLVMIRQRLLLLLFRWRGLFAIDAVRIAQVCVAQTPPSYAVIPRLIATTDVVIAELLDRLESVETSAIDGIVFALTSETLCRTPSLENVARSGRQGWMLALRHVTVARVA
jgi:hypothetical protein